VSDINFVEIVLPSYHTASIERIVLLNGTLFVRLSVSLCLLAPFGVRDVHSFLPHYERFCSSGRFVKQE